MSGARRRWAAIAPLVLGALAGCSERTPPAPAASTAVPASAAAAEAPGVIARFLDGAEIQAETDAQRRELRRALADLLVRPAAELRGARYAGGERSLVELLNAHLLPATPQRLEPESFFADLAHAPAQAAVRAKLAEIDKGLAGH